MYWHSQNYFFLPYNLLLAAIPLLLSHLAVRRVAMREKIVIGMLWLLFFPNAPYILTDLIHLSHKRVAPVFYDVLLILSYGGTGAAFGFLSLRQMQNLLIEKGWPRLSSVFAIGSLFLASFGIYLGRVVRLNSWDVVARPFRFFDSVTDPFINPMDHLSTWAMTVALGVMLSLGYLLFTGLRESVDC